jgi:hypothetical protein
MNLIADLRAAIARTLANEVKAYDLAKACVRFGLAGGSGEEAFANKRRYVESRLDERGLAELLSIGDAVLVEYEGYKLHAFELKEALRFARCSGRLKITEITRRNVLDELMLMGTLWGKMDIHLFLGRLWPVDAMTSMDHRHKTFAEEVFRHMVMNEDWSTPQLLDRLNVLQLSDEAFVELLELVVHPSVREADAQKAWADAINKHIQRDRFALAVADSISGYPAVSGASARCWCRHHAQESDLRFERPHAGHRADRCDPQRHPSRSKRRVLSVLRPPDPRYRPDVAVPCRMVDR